MFTHLEHTKFDGVGLTHKLCLAWLNAEGIPSEMNALAENPELLKDFLEILRGTSDKFRYVIDADTEDAHPRNWGWKILSHKRQGMHEWNPELLHLVDIEREFGANLLDKGFSAKDLLCADPSGKYNNFANACFAKFLVRFPGLIPKEWSKHKRIFFLGTLFESVHQKKQKQEVFFYERMNDGFSHENIEEIYFHSGDFVALLTTK